MGKVPSTGFGSLQNYSRISKRRVVWIDESNSPLQYVYSHKYCGRLRAKYGCGFRKVFADGNGSASETEYQLILARDLEFLPKDSYEKLHNEVEEVKRMLASLLKTIRSDR